MFWINKRIKFEIYTFTLLEILQISIERLFEKAEVRQDLSRCQWCQFWWLRSSIFGLEKCSQELITNFNHSENSKFDMQSFFGDSLYTAHTVSYIQNIVMWITFWKTNVQKFCTFQNAKLNIYLPKYFKKGPFWNFNNKWVDSLTTPQCESYGQDTDTKHKPVSSRPSSF